MQNAIETGRLIRDRVKIPMKYPIKRVKFVDSDSKVLESFKTIERYIIEELNCITIELESEEDKFIVYNCSPENKLIGQALGKANNKEFSKSLRELDNTQLKKYLKGETVEVKGHVMKPGWLKISKSFNAEYA